MKKIAVVIPSYKNETWCVRNLQSVLSQNYSNFRVIYTDDCSPDGTARLVQEFIDKHDASDKVILIQNDERRGAMRNLYDMIHSCEDEEIVVTLDGDDWLAHSDVLKKVDSVYSDPEVWFTWGSYSDHPRNTRGCSKPIPRQVLDAKTYRRQPWCTSHLRTFKAKLFKHIKKEDFYDPNGNWLDMAWDLAFYIPFVEMGGHHGRYIHDILYIYNNENPIQDYKINVKRQGAMDQYIRSKQPYPKLETL
ncbi:MAG: glycosyltransferase family 2 protein [Candidatus Hermodarchaeia archaeon]|jgi:glycosyltransferase involved in cell wall biosynthesis